MARILVADDQVDICELIKMTLVNRGHEVVVAHSGTEALQLAERSVPDLAILDVNMPGMEGTQVARSLRARPATAAVPIILLTALSGESDTLAGFAAGADDYVTKPFNPRELAVRVSALLARTAGGSTSAPATRPQGRVVAVAGPKGGIGRTTIAANLALANQKRAPVERTILLDGNLVLGDLAVHLRLEPSHTVFDLLPYESRVDVYALESALTKHRSGVQVLLAPRKPEQAEQVSAALWREVIQTAAAIADFIVVDTTADYSQEHALTALEMASDILLVVTPEIGAVRNAALFLEVAPKLRLDPGVIKLIVNRANDRAGLTARDIARTLPIAAAAEFPDGGPSFAAQTNLGEPMMDTSQRSDYTRRFQQFAQSLAGRGVARR